MSCNRPAAGLCSAGDFYTADIREDVGAVISQMVYDRIVSQQYHECPLCDCHAITRGVQHPKVFCPDCGLQMVMADQRGDGE